MKPPEPSLHVEPAQGLKFERLLAEISARFVNMPVDRIDSEIEDAQRCICECLGLDLSSLWQWTDGPAGFMTVTHLFSPPEGPERPDKISAAESFPWTFQQLLKGETLAFSTDDLPAAAVQDREARRHFGVKSSVNIPLQIGGESIIGILTFDTLHIRRSWSEETISRLELVAQVFGNALGRKHSEALLEHRLRFESLLTQISAGFINLPPEKIDSQIEDALSRVCKSLDLDFSALWQSPLDASGDYVLTHYYMAVPELPVPGRLAAQETFPWCLQQVEAGRVIAVSTETAPPAAARDQEVWRQYSIKSSLVFPLSQGGGPPMGAISFNTITSERDWPEPVVKNLQLISQIFANALARKRSEEILLKSEARLNLAADSAGAGIWELDCSTRIFWATERARTIFGYGHGEVIRMERFEASVHPDDLDRVRQAIDRALSAHEPIDVEYRIQIESGRFRWIASKGRPYFNAAGEPERLMGVSMDITDRKRMETECRLQLEEIENLKARLENENLYLREELRIEQGFEQIVGESKPLQSVMMAARQVAATDATVLILGETGTGKGLFANAIHQMSNRRARPLVTVNCSALPQNLIESELFGREKGAFTGAHVRQAGRFEVADGGTIFLDEIGEMPLELQPKLLRVLQEGEFERLGSSRPVSVDVRVIAATSRDLKKEVRAGRFRTDLFYRLNVFPISLPPLRERIEDIPFLSRYFVKKYAGKMKKPIDNIPKSVVRTLSNYNWPGNVRELEHIIERGVITTRGAAFQLNDPLTCDPAGNSNDPPLKDLAEMERSHILEVLHRTGWKIEGSSGAAAILKLHPSTLRFRIKKLDIRRPS